MRTSITLFVSCCCLGSLAAAESTPDPATAIAADAVAMVRFNDLPRSAIRYQQTPYARLMESALGKRAREELSLAMRSALPHGIDPAAVAGSARRLAFGIHLPTTIPLSPWLQVATTVDDPAPLTAALAPLFPNQLAAGDPAVDTLMGAAGSLQWRDRLAVFTSINAPGMADQHAPAITASVWPTIDAAADVEGTYRTEAAFTAVEAHGHQAPRARSLPTMTFSLRFDRIGMREHADLTYAPADMARLEDVTWKPADTRLFASLPASTLSALVIRCDGDLTRRWIELHGEGIDEPSLARIDALLQTQGLPAYWDLMTRLDGDILVYTEESAPFPVVSAVMAIDPAIGSRLIEVIRTHLLGPPGDAMLGMIGPVAIYGEQRGPDLILTTNPAGIDAVAMRQKGFTDHAEIREALAEIKADAIVAGVSRSGASWGTVAQLAAIPLSALGIRQLMTLPQDVRKAGRYGFVSCSPNASGFSLDAGGLLGGPIGCCMFGAMGPALAIPNLMRASADRVETEGPREVTPPLKSF
ncbi:MAG: hypothetical protein H0V44_08295 [Planctomycetes bacterium]|nr:hypothetical protein [Planctomycetota bacterium]